MRRCLGWQLTLLAILVSGCARPAARPDILFLVSDTLRADALSCYGGVSQTPNLCALAARGALFERAYVGSPWTLPSVASMMTGNSAGQYARPDPAAPELLRFRVPDEEVLLVEALHTSGYRTLLSVENDVAVRSHALQGFGAWPGSAKSSAAIEVDWGLDLSMNRHAKLLPVLRFLAAPQPEPFFLLYWFRDPHAPYNPPAHFHARLTTEAATLPRPLGFYTGLGHANNPERGEMKLRDALPMLSPAELRFIRRLYHLEIESIDERVGALLRALERSGRGDNTIVVFTSDHGESFGERGTYLHGQGYHDEVVRVPLILAGPGIPAGNRVREPVSHLDLMPTLAALLGVEMPSQVQGRSLREELRGSERRAGERPVLYLVNPIREPDTDAVVDGRYKLIVDRRRGQFELYDLEADPGENTNLAASEKAVVARLELAARRFRDHNERRRLALAGPDGAPTLSPEDEETQRRLKALGYLD